MYRQSENNLLNSNTSSTCPDNMVNFGLLAAEICWRVWGTPANFNGFRVLAALLHCTLVVGVSQTLRHLTEGAIYVRQGSHHVGHWPTFLVGTTFMISRPHCVWTRDAFDTPVYIHVIRSCCTSVEVSSADALGWLMIHACWILLRLFHWTAAETALNHLMSSLVHVISRSVCISCFICA